MLDIDDFKRVNDVYGHGTGDEVLRSLAATLRGMVRQSDVVCRLGGEEFGIILPACDEQLARGLADRITDVLLAFDFEGAGRITISVGLAHGPEHAMNPRELIACAEAAMMTAKARGKNQIILFEEHASERPDGAPASGRDVRSIAHLKMLQSLAGKLNRLNDVRQIGAVIADELRLLIDYHNCRVSVVEGDDVVPIAFRGELISRDGERVDFPSTKIGTGITGHVAATGEALLVGNTLECEYAVTIPGTHAIEESQIAVPLCYGARVIGVIGISKLGVDQFDEDDVRLLEVLAGHASVAVENARLYEAQRREADHLKALLEFTGAISHATTPEAIGKETVQAASRLIGGKDCALWLRDGSEFRVAAHTEYDRDPKLRPLLDFAIPADVVDTNFADQLEPVLLDGETAERLTAPPPGLRWPDVALAPLRTDSRIEGWITVRDPSVDSEHSTEELIRLLAGISRQAAVALERARSFESLEDTFVSTVEALANALEANDEYTSSHTRWITDMALKVGRELGFEGEALKRLELGALFHDIGKIGVPTSILLKPGPLSAEERKIIELHPELGERILAPIDRLADVRTIVRSCHERWDGGGYPDGRPGEQIPLEARIILVCDAFHAMTTDRPYRKRLSIDEACRRLREGAGTQFDPAVVDVFLALPREAPFGLEAPATAPASERLAS
jgi:diguanylate cyclase (GGDEF)-like protein